MKYSEFLVEYKKFRHELSTAYSLGAPSHQIAQGSFTFDELDIFLPFINDENLSWLGERQLLFGQYYSPLAESERHKVLLPNDIKDLDASGADITKLISYMEVTNHEHFHALQTLTLQSVWQLVFAFQEIAHVRTSIAVYLIKMGRKFSEGSIFENLLDTDYDQVLRQKSLGLIQRFQEIRSAIQVDSAGLSTLGLIENSAFIAQKISCRSFSFDTFQVQDGTVYSNSFAYWRKHGGQEPSAFLIAAHSALRLGCLNAASGELSPVDIFREYAEKAMEIEKTMADEVSHSEKPSAFMEKKFFGAPKPLSVSDLLNAVKKQEANEIFQKTGTYKALKHGLGWSEDELEHLFPENEEELALIHTKQLGDLPHQFLDAAQKILLQLPASMVKKISILHPISRIKFESEVYLSNIGRKIYENIPGIYSEKYFINWLLNEGVRKEFQTLFKNVSFDEEPEQIELNTVALSIFEFRILSKFFNELETLLMYDPARHIPLPICCSAHGHPTDCDILLNCDEKDSLNSRSIRMFEKPLASFLNC